MTKRTVMAPPEVERLWLDLIRDATPWGNFLLTCALSQYAIHASKQAIREAHREMDEEEVQLAFVAKHYGQELADKVRESLARRRASQSLG